METTENTTDTPTPDAAPTAAPADVQGETSANAQVPEVPGSIGKLTPDEQQALV